MNLSSTKMRMISHKTDTANNKEISSKLYQKLAINIDIFECETQILLTTWLWQDTELIRGAIHTKPNSYLSFFKETLSQSPEFHRSLNEWNI